MVSVHRGLQPRRAHSSQPRWEVCPACWPRPGLPPAPHGPWCLQNHREGVSPSQTTLPPPAGAAQLVALGALLLQIQRLCIWKPNIQHVVLWTKQTAMASQCLYLSTPKGQTVVSPFVLRPLLHMPYCFLTLFLFLGNFSYDYYVFWWFAVLFYLQVILFSYGQEKRKWGEYLRL